MDYLGGRFCSYPGCLRFRPSPSRGDYGYHRGGGELQQLGQYQANWILYRATSEALKHKKYLYLSMAGPYQGVPNPDILLGERVEQLVSQEHANWTAVRQENRGNNRKPWYRAATRRNPLCDAFGISDGRIISVLTYGKAGLTVRYG